MASNNTLLESKLLNTVLKYATPYHRLSETEHRKIIYKEANYNSPYMLDDKILVRVTFSAYNLYSTRTIYVDNVFKKAIFLDGTHNYWKSFLMPSS